MNLNKIINNPRTIQAMLGISKIEFNNLLPLFELSVLEMNKSRSTAHIRKFGGGAKGKLDAVDKKLFFILFYVKTYPTFDVLGAIIDFDKTNANKNTILLLNSLQKALGKKIVLPERKVNSLEELFKKFPEIKDVFADGLERPVQRPKKKKAQNKLYSGKKKNHARKSIVITDENKKILLITPSKSARRHDKKLADKNCLFEHIPEHITVWVDTGFQGILKQHSNTMIPSKRSKGKPFTLEQKQENKTISSIRVIVEHAISAIKRFRSVSEKLRNHTANIDDIFLTIASGLWNLHLQHTR